MKIPDFRILQTEADLLTMRGRFGRWKEKYKLNDAEIKVLDIVDAKFADANELLKALRENVL